MKAQIELTDTFGGEANYSWVDRYEFECDGMTDRQIIRKARQLIGITGVQTVKSDFGDTIQWDITGACIRAFLTFNCEQ
jgi:hypothetical protein